MSIRRLLTPKSVCRPARGDQSLQLIRNPRAVLEGWVKQYGDPFLLNALNGPVVVTGREDLIRTIFGGDDRELATQLTDASRRVVASSSPLLFFSRKTHVPFLGLSPWDRWTRAKKELFQLLEKGIEKR